MTFPAPTHAHQDPRRVTSRLRRPAAEHRRQAPLPAARVPQPPFLSGPEPSASRSDSCEEVRIHARTGNADRTGHGPAGCGFEGGTIMTTERPMQVGMVG